MLEVRGQEEGTGEHGTDVSRQRGEGNHYPMEKKRKGCEVRHNNNNYTFPVRRLGVFRDDLMITR